MADAIVGRSDELDRIVALIDGDVGGMRALVLTGEPGIGKTELVLEAVRLARDRGLRTVITRPAEADAALPYAGLTDLLEGLPERGGGLPDAQREALDVALARRPLREPIERAAVARAALATLRDAAHPGLVIAVDDAQWVDTETSEVLTFALRRLVDEAVAVVASYRPGDGDDVPFGLGRALRSERLERLSLGPLALDELEGLVDARAGFRLPRPRIVALHELSGGNPLVALELLRAGTAEPHLQLRLPPTLAVALAARLAQLSPAGLDAVRAAAAALRPTAALVKALAGERGLDEARDVGGLEGDERLRFSHPTIRSAAYSAMTADERRGLHRRLADAVHDPVERSHHLALAVRTADERVAAELDQGAILAFQRGAPALGARLAERAVELTPEAGRRHAVRRSLHAAELHQLAGDWRRSREILEQAEPHLDDGRERARARMLAADVRLGRTIGTVDAMRELQLALEDAAADDQLTLELEARLTDIMFLLGRPQEALRHARRAAELAERTGADAMLALALSEEGFARCMLGEGITDSIRRANDLWRQDTLGVSYPPPLALGVMHLWLDNAAEARRLLRHTLAEADARGLERPFGAAHTHLAELELRAGAWRRAYEHSQACALAFERSDDRQGVVAALHAQASVEAHLGDLAAAAAHATEGLARAESFGDVWWSLQHRGTLGFVSVTADDHAAAFAHLDPAVEALIAMDLGEVTVFPVAHLGIEAAIGTGRLDRAERVIAFVEEKGRLTGRAWNRAIAARGRALLAAARGDVADARRHAEEALAAHESLPQPFERARMLLVAGTVERRTKRWAAARERFTDALELFDQLGAAAWAERAAAELARLPGRRPKEPGLTETERRIAALVADGLSNKEIAASLFVTVRTVEANLTKVYAKLGIRSRTELASHLRA